LKNENENASMTILFSIIVKKVSRLPFASDSCYFFSPSKPSCYRALAPTAAFSRTLIILSSKKRSGKDGGEGGIKNRGKGWMTNNKERERAYVMYGSENEED
jgi:hypothetical protein